MALGRAGSSWGRARVNSRRELPNMCACLSHVFNCGQREFGLNRCASPPSDYPLFGHPRTGSERTVRPRTPHQFTRYTIVT